MQNILLAALILEKARVLIAATDFLVEQRVNDRAFTRNRKLGFQVVMLLILQKSIKSLQVHLHEFFHAITGMAKAAVTPGAWTQARAKLRHTAFIKLNEVAVVKVLYETPGAAVNWRGHRLLALDGSTLRMPFSKALFAHFGGQEPSNQSGPCGGRVPQARLSVLYDVCNRIGIDARVCQFTQGEVELACEHLAVVGERDVILSDRGYAGYPFLAKIRATGGHFVIRCQKQSFAEAKSLFERGQENSSVVVTLPAKSRELEARAAGLPTQLEVRFVCVKLPTGELEVLVTSLIDEASYPTEEFLALYERRWGIETYFQVLKGRLDLENFTGLTAEAVLQDIHAAVFLSNLESVVTREAAAQMKQTNDQGDRHPIQPNKAVTFHAMKSRLLELLLGKDPIERVLCELTELFLANPVSVRPNRKPPRTNPTPLRSLHFQKRVRKTVF